MSKGKTVGKIIAYVLVLLVVVGVIGVIVRFTGGFTSDFKTFYVTVDGKDVLTTASGYKLTTTQPLTVDVKYTFGSAGGDASGYSVKIVPNVIENEDFDFTLNGDVYSYQAETDLTAGAAKLRLRSRPKADLRKFSKQSIRTTKSAIAGRIATRICTRSS